MDYARACSQLSELNITKGLKFRINNSRYGISTKNRDLLVAICHKLISSRLQRRLIVEYLEARFAVCLFEEEK